jgi:DNA-binding NarL/FixJ family response regulator
MESRASALIIAPSARIRDSLLVLLRAIPQIETVYQAEDGPSALAVGLQVQPLLIMVDYDLPENELRTTLRQIKSAWPQAQRLVLLDDEQDHRPAQEAGADHVLVKGVRAATVLETIESLILEDS